MVLRTLVISILATIFICASFRAKAQFNDSTFYYAYYSATGNYAKTNDQNSTVLNNLAKFSLEKKFISVQTTDGWIYGKQSGVTINNDFSSVLEADFLKKERELYYWGLGTFDKSFSLKINHRFQMGAGVGFSILNKTNTYLVLSDGIIYETGDLTDSEIGKINYEVWRNSFRLKYHLAIGNIVTLDETGFLQPSITTRHDNIIKSNTTLSIKIKKWLSLSSAVTYNRLTRTEKENFIVTGGVTFGSFF